MRRWWLGKSNKSYTIVRPKHNVVQITVRQLGLATGQLVIVRRVQSGVVRHITVRHITGEN